MGRQAHLARLALGRSPYGEPLTDEDGEFILGPHAHDCDNVGYRQQFDARGHPENLSTITAARKLRRAQNNVLAAVGVVARKGEANKTEWEKMKANDKRHSLKQENNEGRELKFADRLLGFTTTWWITSLRHRVMSYQNHTHKPVIHTLWQESQLRGATSFFVNGLSSHLLSTLAQNYRFYCRDPDVENIVNYPDPGNTYPYFELDQVQSACTEILAFAISIPLQVLSCLQSLSLIRSDVWMDWRFFVPFTRMSPLWLPPSPTVENANDILTTSLKTLYTPLMTAVIRDYLHTQIRFRIYSLLRQTMSSAERPDAISIAVSDSDSELEDTSIPGIGSTRARDSHARRRYGPRSFIGAFRQAFPPLYQVSNFLSGGRIGRSRGRLTDDLNIHLRSLVRSSFCTQRDLAGADSSNNIQGRPELLWEVMDDVFDEHGLDCEEELVDPAAWAADACKDIDHNSTAEEQASGQPSSPFPLSSLQVYMARALFLSTEGADDTTFNIPINYRDVHIQATFNGMDIILTDLSDIPVMVPDLIADERDLTVAIGNYNPLGNSLPNADNHLVVCAGQSRREFLRAWLAWANDQLEDDFEGNYLDLGDDRAIQITSFDPTHDNFGQRAVTRPNLPASPPTPTPGLSRATSLLDSQHLPPPRDQTFEPLQPRSIRYSTDPEPGLGPGIELGPAPGPGAEPETTSMADADADATTTRRIEDLLQEFETSILSSISSSSSSSTTSSNPHNQPIQPPHPNDNTQPFHHPHLQRIPTPTVKRQHRTTLLSTFAIDSLAWHTSSLLTTLLLLPIETLYLRSITTWFLTTPAMSSYINVDALLVNGPVLRIGEWLGGSGAGIDRFRYVGVVLLTVGMEMMVRGVIWGIGTRITVRKGVWRYGWGKF